MAPCDGAGKDQVQPHKWGFSLGQGLPDLFFALALPNQKNRREIGIKRQLVFRVLRLDPLYAAMNDRADDPHMQTLEIDVLPLKRQHLFGPETGALSHHSCGGQPTAQRTPHAKAERVHLLARGSPARLPGRGSCAVYLLVGLFAPVSEETMTRSPERLAG